MTKQSQSGESDVFNPIVKLESLIAKLEERTRSLEDDRLRVKAWAALIVFAGSVAAFFISKFGST